MVNVLDYLILRRSKQTLSNRKQCHDLTAIFSNERVNSYAMYMLTSTEFYKIFKVIFSGRYYASIVRSYVKYSPIEYVCLINVSIENVLV